MLPCLLMLANLLIPLATGAADRDLLGQTVAALAAPELAGRGAGTADERRAAELIAGWFADAHLEPALPAGGWLQAVPWGDRETLNVLAVARGRGTLADRWVVVGAHLDHLGRVDPGAAGDPEIGGYYPGAGDNASGVAVVRWLADRLGGEADQTGDRRSVLVCAFGGEEEGLVGSRYLVSHLPIPVETVDAMLNLDAVGRLEQGPLHVAGAGTCDQFAHLLAAAADGVPLVLHEPLLLGSDHLGFLEAGIPALFCFTSAYPEMNSPADLPSSVDLDGLATVAGLAGDLLDGLRTSAGPFTFVAPTPVQRPEGGNRATWFGTAPDFSGATSDDGYLIGGVTPGGPAARAGLRTGDVVVTLGGGAVKDLATFTQRLRSFAPGEVVEVAALRDGRRMTFLVTLGDRSQR
ncbi:MAG: M28 family peptidase [Candidatus Krumholzibacteriia bacterium]